MMLRRHLWIHEVSWLYNWVGDKRVIEYLKRKHLQFSNEEYSNFITVVYKKDSQLGLYLPPPVDGLAKKLRIMREHLLNRTFCKKKVVCQIPLLSIQKTPLFFEINYRSCRMQQTALSGSGGKYHVFVLIHGLDAKHLTMKTLLKEISLVCENAEFIIPRSKIWLSQPIMHIVN